MRRRLLTTISPVCQIIETDGTIHDFYYYEDAKEFAFNASSSDQFEIHCIKGDIPDNFMYNSSSSIAPCTWTSIIIGENVTSIGSEAFMSNNYSGTGLTISGTDLVIGSSAFQQVTIGGTLTLNNGVKRVENIAFSTTQVTTVIMPATLEYLGSQAFTSVSSSLPSSASFYGTRDIEYGTLTLLGGPFGWSSVSTVRVPTNYSGSTFCGVTVSKVL